MNDIYNEMSCEQLINMNDEILKDVLINQNIFS